MSLALNRYLFNKLNAQLIATALIYCAEPLKSADSCSPQRVYCDQSAETIAGSEFR